VTVGFTAGIAVIIFASQIRPLLGLTLPGSEPGPLAEKLPALAGAIGTVEGAAVALSLGTIAVIVALKRLRPNWPGMLIAVAGSAAATALFGLEVETIGSVFGGIPQSFPMPSLPAISLEKAQAVLPAAIAFALLGSIESLLSAVVADGMTGRRHRSNCELVAQGVANVGSALFGGICVTGTIARTATNVRAGAHGPVSGMLHAVFLLAFVLIAAPLASDIPLAALAGVLAFVAWNMVEKHAFLTLLRASRGDAAVLLATFGLTVFRDLTEAIVVGFALGSVLFIHRMSKVTAVESAVPFVAEDERDDRPDYEETAADRDTVVYRITGAFFFGAAASIGSVLDRIADSHRRLIVDLAAVPFIDSTAANTIESLLARARRNGVEIVLTGASSDIRRALAAHGIAAPAVTMAPTIEAALARPLTGKAEP